MHDNTWRAYDGPGRKGDSGDGGVLSYQAPSKVHGKAGCTCDGRKKCARGSIGLSEAHSASSMGSEA